MRTLLLNYVNSGISCGVFILLFWGCSAAIDRRYAAKWKRLVWLLVSLRLVLPFGLHLTRPKLVIPVAQGELSGEWVPLVLGQTAGTAAPWTVSVLGILAALWLAGAAVSAGVYMVSYVRCRLRIRGEGRPVEDEAALAILRAEAGRLRLPYPPRTVCWTGCVSPMVIGVVRPLLVLPGEDYTPEELWLIFRHELNHIKRGDLALKALMAVAKALHWYNPAVRLMPVLADVDMELSCDDEVTRDSSDAVRKAYSEILFSFVRRQYSPGAAIPARAYTTQFYGGKQIMKKRFGNILSSGQKKRGVLLLALAAAVILTAGSLAACGEAPAQTPEARGEVDPTPSPAPTPLEMATPEPTPMPMKMEMDSSLPDGAELSDREALNRMITDFADGYFSGDAKKVAEVLSASPESVLEVYPGGGVTNVMVKGLDKVPDQAVEGGLYPISVQFLPEGEDSLTYLTIEVVKEGGRWQVQWYGLEK